MIKTVQTRMSSYAVKIMPWTGQQSAIVAILGQLLFGTPDLFNISYSRELYLFSKFLHFEEIVRAKMAVCFEMTVSET